MPPLKGSAPANVSLTMQRLALTHPDYITVGAAAKILDVARSTVYESDIPRETVDGVRLFKRSDVEAKRRTMTRNQPTRLTVKGIDVERLRQICETFYRTQKDVAELHLLALAKRIARL